MAINSMFNKIFECAPSSHLSFQTLFNFLLLFTVLSSSVIAQTPVGVKTDLNVYQEGTAPALSSAGTKTTDPVFGTQVMRVTDGLSGNNNGTAYSYWATFNLNNTRLLALADSTATMYQFDPVTFVLGSKRTIPLPPGSGNSTDEDAIWSGIDPDKFFVHQGAAFYAFNASVGTYSLVGYLSDQFPAGSYFWQMSVSRDDDIFAFTVRNSDYSVGGYAVWRRSTNTVIYSVRTSILDEVQIDKTGRYLVVKTGLEGPGAIQDKVVDLQTQVVTDLTDNGPDFAPGHSDNGRGTVIGEDNWNNALTIRNLANPHVITNALNWGNNWANGGGHVSFLGDNESWALVSSFNTARGVGVFNNEIYLVATDGSQRVRRFVHHYSYYVADYYNSPRANISRDGKFVAFTSTWGNSGRRDLFIAKVPQEVGARPWDSLPIGGNTKLSVKAEPLLPVFTQTTIVKKSKNGKTILTNQ